jgi:hypothetical protein
MVPTGDPRLDRRRLPAVPDGGEGGTVSATPSPAGGLAEGERRRDRALDLLRLRRACLVRRVQRALLCHLLAHGPNTTDPVRALVPLPPGTDPRLIGAAVRGLAELCLIRRAGLARSVRPVAHGRDLATWEITDRQAAADWLLAHPDTDTPDTAPAATVQRDLWD